MNFLKAVSSSSLLDITVEPLYSEVLGIKNDFFIPVIVKYIEKNFVIVNKFCQSLGPSLYRGSTVFSFVFVLRFSPATMSIKGKSWWSTGFLVLKYYIKNLVFKIFFFFFLFFFFSLQNAFSFELGKNCLKKRINE